MAVLSWLKTGKKYKISLRGRLNADQISLSGRLDCGRANGCNSIRGRHVSFLKLFGLLLAAVCISSDIERSGCMTTPDHNFIECV